MVVVYFVLAKSRTDSHPNPHQSPCNFNWTKYMVCTMVCPSLGVSPIPSWCVGILFGLSGSMLNSLLEGSWYLTSQFWLPLIAVTLLKFQQTKKRKWYVWLIVSWIGALLTSAYLGLAASVMLLFLTLYIQPYRNRKRWFIQILGPMLIIGTVFTLLFLSLYNRREFDNLDLSMDGQQWVAPIFHHLFLNKI